MPRRILGIRAKMEIKIIAMDGNGRIVDSNVLASISIKAALTSNKKPCPVDNNAYGTFTLCVIPEQLGESQLSITANDQPIQGSPFNITIVPQRDYTTIHSPKQLITDLNNPRFIAFSDDGDMFVTCGEEDCLRVYDPTSGMLKRTIGTSGSGELQFDAPCGIDIKGDTVYVCERRGHRIHLLTTSGKFIGTFGKEGSGIGQFKKPFDVKVSTDGKIYVADSRNDRVQVFNRNWTVSHIFTGTEQKHLSRPEGIAFDLSGNVHVTWWGSGAVTVHHPDYGAFEREYSTSANGPTGIAIDPSGYSLVVSYNEGVVLVYNVEGKLIHKIVSLRLRDPYGIAVAPVDGSVWVAEKNGNQNTLLLIVAISNY